MLKSGMFISDRYEIIERVGSGGMSDVYKAKCHKLNRFVAIKILKQEFSEDKSFVAKFKTEAQSAAGLSHPNIVNVYDVGEDNGLYYIVMELIEGITLKHYIERKGSLTIKESVSIAIQVAQGIECAHNNQIIHRDIKPQNIIISKEGKVKVTDFGIARAATANTVNSNAMGSVHYISPEQARGGYTDEKSDIYSLGITLFEMLTGRVPFEGDSTVTVALQHIQKDLPNLKEIVPDIPVSVEKIVYKCTQKKADRRYLKISSLISDLKRSLVTPDEDFVVLTPVNPVGTTIKISDDEVSIIRKAAGYTTDNPEDDDFIPDSDEDREEVEIPNDEDDDIDAVNPKLDKIITVGSIVVGVVFLIFLIVVFSKFMRKTGINSELSTSVTKATETTLDAKETKVPNLIGMTEDEAQAALNENSLGIEFEYDYDEDIEKDLVCKQSEEAGSIVSKNITITVTISKGAERQDMIDVVGMDIEGATAELEKLGLIVEVEYEYSSKDIGTVLEQSLSTKANVTKGESVTLKVSRGNEYSTTTIVPNLVGITQSSAKSKLSSAGLKVGSVTKEYSDTVSKGKVIKQFVKAGTEIPINSSVSYIVSLGPEETTTEETTEEKTQEETTTAESTSETESTTAEETTTDGTETISDDVEAE